MQQLEKLCQSKNIKVAVRIVTALGYLAASRHGNPETMMAYIKLLLSLHTRKEDQLQFAIGEALCFAHQGAVLDARHSREDESNRRQGTCKTSRIRPYMLRADHRLQVKLPC